jgi:hypothetical protein
MKGKYSGGKRIGNQLYVRCGGLWVEILALAQIEKEEKYYGPYIV